MALLFLTYEHLQLVPCSNKATITFPICSFHVLFMYRYFRNMNKTPWLAVFWQQLTGCQQASCPHSHCLTRIGFVRMESSANVWNKRKPFFNTGFFPPAGGLTHPTPQAREKALGKEVVHCLYLYLTKTLLALNNSQNTLLFL